MKDVYPQVKDAVREARSNGETLGRVRIQRDFDLTQAEARKMRLKAITELDMEERGDTSSLAVPSTVDSGDNYLKLADNITLEDFNAFAQSLIIYEKRRPWLWGDMFTELKRLWLMRNPGAINYMINKDPFAEVLLANSQYLPSDISEHIKVSELFGHDRRVEGLSWTHHRIAAYSNTEEKTPQDWIADASKYGWSRAELKEQIDDFKDRGGSDSDDWSKGFTEVGRYTNRIQSIFRLEVSKAKPSDRAKFIELLEPIVKLYRELTPGKESL